MKSTGISSPSAPAAFAEYVCLPEKALAKKPSNLTFEQAAAVPMAALTALQGLRDLGQIQAGQKVLIYGASGGVGTFAVQIARAFGAEVTAVCSTGKMDMVRSIGAGHVIDYTREDFTGNGQCYDLILAANGYRSIFKYRNALTPAGTYVMAGGSMSQIFQAMLLGPHALEIGRQEVDRCVDQGQPGGLALYQGADRRRQSDSCGRQVLSI